MTKKTNNFNRNPNGSNQWKTRSNEEIQKIINRHPKHWTKKDFRGEGKNNQNKILTRKETERTGLVFGSAGGVKQYQNGKLKCSMCGTFKSLDEFPDDKYGSSNGKRSNCSSCDIIRNQRYRLSLKEIS
tara:strand:+ start:287 stop:673 length:387 start_codon:yes stop_codon:yes gene_type:complete